jgi:transposase
MTEDLRNEIVQRWQGGTPQRAIARQLGVSRGAVGRALARHRQARSGPTPPERQRPSLLDAYETTIQELLGRYPDLTATRLLEELRSRGFTGGYTIVRQRLRDVRPRPAIRPVVRFETGPGVQAQMDYAVYDLEFTDEGRRRVNLFSYVLGYSRRQYLRFVEAQDFDTTVQQHVRAFEHLGGVAATCLYDNMKVVVSRHDGEQPLYNPRFLAFATHYGFRPVACRPRRPQTKGKVERPFHYVETNLLNGRTFRSLADLNVVTAKWLAEVADVRTHRETQQTPLERHAQEQPHLIALPAVAYEVAPVEYRTVNVDGFLVWRQNRYSVPWRYLGQILPVRITEEELIVYDGQLAEIARHRRLPRNVSGQPSLQAEHHPSPDGAPRSALLRERYAELGETAARFFDGLVRTQRYHRDHAQRVLGWLGTYARVDWLAALDRAVRYGAYAASAVERILAAQARPQSLPFLGTDDPPLTLSADDDTAVRPRPTSEYQPLLREEPGPDEPLPEAPSFQTQLPAVQLPTVQSPTVQPSDIEECPF